MTDCVKTSFGGLTYSTHHVNSTASVPFVSRSACVCDERVPVLHLFDFFGAAPSDGERASI